MSASPAEGFDFREQQDDLRAMVRTLLDKRSAEADVRATMETDLGFDRSLWDQAGSELGLCGLAVPEEYGGAGYGWLELAVVLEEFGRSLACLPYLSSVVLAQGVLLAASSEDGGDDAARRWLPGLASGVSRGTVAVSEQAGRWTEDTIGTAARQTGGEWRLTGTKTFVLDGMSADLLLVAARHPAGVAFFALDAGAPDAGASDPGASDPGAGDPGAGDTDTVTRVPMQTMDRTRRLARLELRDAPAVLVGTPESGPRILEALVDRAALALALDCVGGAARMLETTVAYARTREQFGHPIGGFQAIKHRCTEMLLELETARSAAHGALWAAADGQPEASAYASLAKSQCADAYGYVTKEAIQVHGGIGFTWEHPAHLYFRRAKTNQVLGGDSTHHRDRMLRLLGAGR